MSASDPFGFKLPKSGRPGRTPMCMGPPSALPNSRPSGSLSGRTFVSIIVAHFQDEQARDQHQDAGSQGNGRVHLDCDGEADHEIPERQKAVTPVGGHARDPGLPHGDGRSATSIVQRDDAGCGQSEIRNCTGAPLRLRKAVNGEYEIGAQSLKLYRIPRNGRDAVKLVRFGYHPAEPTPTTSVTFLPPT